MDKARRKATEVVASPRRGQAQVPTDVSKARQLFAQRDKDDRDRKSGVKGQTSRPVSSKGLDTAKRIVKSKIIEKKESSKNANSSKPKESGRSKGKVEASPDPALSLKKLKQKVEVSAPANKTKAENGLSRRKSQDLKQNNEQARPKKVEIGFKTSTIPNLPPGVYFDDKTIGRTEPTFPIDAEKALLAAGPFGIGEAKACLDDLQATLLNYYGKLYRIEPSMPLDWQIDQLRRSYYPSPAPISGHVDRAGLAVDLGELAGALPPPFPNGLSTMTPDGKFANVSPDGLLYNNVTFMRGTPQDKRDEAKTRIQPPKASGDEKSESEALKDSGGQRKETGKSKEGGSGRKETGGTSGGRKASSGEPSKPTLKEGSRKTDETEVVGAVREKSLSFGISEVIGDLHEIAEKNMLKINRLGKEIDSEVGDPTSIYYWRGDAMPRGARRPTYYSNRNERGHMNELEDHVESLYRNLLTRTEWNKRKIRLMQDKMKLITGDASFRGDPRSAF